MGYKIVCLTCRKAFSIGPDYLKPEKCSEWGGNYLSYNHKFRPPKKDDLKAWKVVSFLNEYGFNYQHVKESNGEYVGYPTTLEEAKEFVDKYQKQATNTME